MQIVTRFADTENPRGIVLVAHGYGEHQGRYTFFHDALQRDGYDVAYYDFYGHGKSGGPRSCVDVGKLIRDHSRARQQVLQQSRTSHLFLFGHSMGGLISVASAILHPQNLSGVVLTGPALRPLPAVPAEVARSLLSAARYVPGLPVALTKRTPESSLLSRNPDVQRAFDADPLCYHGPVPLLTASTMVVQGDEVLQRCAHLSVPTLIFHGTEDRLTAPEASRQLIDGATAAGNGDAHLRLVDGARHEVLQEVEGPGIIRDILLWLHTH
ncbi:MULTISPECIES: alpha/beta hydrolase [unclassified Schaalia]|uniref:alpha/beta hydrolase n=1 Tax=unclassified Schaalia TaxID=2691889 RepID=UPI001E4CB5BD|nr:MULTISPECIES: alpha/beta hydrolase [unclassified Schaalia]MCD4550297.1 alpha/beta hydrolase [Schaalia sp. lx-260]MCD4558085.1 alpha/beta hydrolase [Schaalia sp. lx-100]